MDIVASALAGAVAFRIRGGMLGPFLPWFGTTLSRLAWALSMGGVAFWAGGWRVALVAAPVAFLGSVFGWWSGLNPDYHGPIVGRNEPWSWWRMAWRGFVFAPFIGLACPALYWIGWRLRDQQHRPWSKHWWRAQEPGEVLFGAWCGIGVYLVGVQPW